MTYRRFLLLATVLVLLGGVLPATAADRQAPVGQSPYSIPRPDGKESFITDQADLIASEDEAKINALCKELLQKRATPIIVVTIPSMQAVGGQPGMRIETFARFLFDGWGIGHEKIQLNDKETVWNTGVLLLVSKGDRKARIELGAHWGHEHDDFCQTIMDEVIIPRFKKEEFSGGIVGGVESLANMVADKLEIPEGAKVPRPWWHYALIVGFVGLVAFTVVSLIRRGASGWAWIFWGVVFSVLGVLLYQLLTSRSRGGGGFGGGSFGGGFSGGGGATGSW